MENNYIGDKLRQIRYNLNLTQEKLGEKANLHYSYIGQVERGDKTPSLKALMKISAALNIPVEELVKEEEFGQKDISDLKLKNIEGLLEDRSPAELDLIYKLLCDLIEYIDADIE